jgi:large subunit ribosomal protein L32
VAELVLTIHSALKTNILGQINWAVRRPTTKQAKQMARERRQDKKQQRALEPDPRKEKEEQVLKHTGWKG